MGIEIGDRVMVRSIKDLFNEYGNDLEPYNPTLGINNHFLGLIGEVKNEEDYMGNSAVEVFFLDAKQGAIKWWWFYPEVLYKVSEYDKRYEKMFLEGV